MEAPTDNSRFFHATETTRRKKEKKKETKSKGFFQKVVRLLKIKKGYTILKKHLFLEPVCRELW